MSEDRGVWHSRAGAKGQSRFSASQRPDLGPFEKKQSQPSNTGAAGRGQGTGKEQGLTWMGPETTQPPGRRSLPLAEDHVPVNGYNAGAVEAAMKASAEPRPSLYKPTDKLHTGARSGSAPWGSKANCMANGKDFWLDLRKQFTALQRSGGTREGG